MDSKGERRCLVGRGQYEEGILVGVVSCDF